MVKPIRFIATMSINCVIENKNDPFEGAMVTQAFACMGEIPFLPHEGMEIEFGYTRFAVSHLTWMSDDNTLEIHLADTTYNNESDYRDAVRELEKQAAFTTEGIEND
jgi:hypothetical protein